MSSLAATQSDAYYRPPEYFESGAYRKKGLNAFAGSKGHNPYLQRGVVRFELPYDGFCEGPSCQAHVGKGTRFNAHKTNENGECYLSTKIWTFTTKCRACGKQEFVIKTNPVGRCFDYVSGIRRKVEEYDTLDAGTAGVVVMEGGVVEVQHHNLKKKSEGETLSSSAGENDFGENPLDKLERTAASQRKVLSEHDHLVALQTLQERTYGPGRDADLNSLLRARSRAERKDRETRRQETLLKGLGRGILLEKKSTSTENGQEGAHLREGIRRRRAAETDDDARWKQARRSSIFGRRNRKRERELRSTSSNITTGTAEWTTAISHNRDVKSKPKKPVVATAPTVTFTRRKNNTQQKPMSVSINPLMAYDSDSD